MVNFVSPGVGGFPGSQVTVDTSPGQGANPGFLRPYYYPKKVLQSGHAQVFRPSLEMDITVRGINIVTNNLELWEAILPGAVWVAMNQAGQEMTRHARKNMIEWPPKPIIESGDTYRSIHHFMSTTATEITASAGPTTFYAPFIEYGMGGHMGKGPRPFMSKAAYDALPELILAFVDLAAMIGKGGKGQITSRPYKPPLDSYLSRWRNFMYTVEKEIGDLVIPGFSISGLSQLRSTLLSTARVLGDVQAVMGAAVGARFTRRLSGKVTGRAIGIGSRTIFTNKTYTASISGGQRIYNRLAGKYATRFAQFGGFGG